MHTAAEGYLTLASHISKLTPYKLSQVIAQIPPPPKDVPMLIRKALAIHGESKTIHYLLHSEYELNNTSWSKYSINTMYPIIQYTRHSQEKEDLEVHSINKEENGQQRKELQLQCHLITLPIIN